MNTINAGKAQRKRYFLIALFSLSSMALATLLTFFVAQRQLEAQIIQQTVPIQNAVESLLAEAQAVARKADQWVNKKCDARLQNQLNTLTAHEMRMLVVNLLDKDRIYCSSLLDNIGHRVNLSSFGTGSIKIDNTMASVGIPVLSLYQRLPGGGVIVSADLRYLWGIMGNANLDRRFVLQINDNLLTKQGILKGEEAKRILADYTRHEISDFYTLSWRLPDRHEVWQEIGQSWIYLFLIIAPSFLLTLLAWMVMSRRRSLEQHLATAIYNDHIKPHYQPIISACDNRVIGAEILARWEHHDLGFVRPDIFIPLAEKNHLIGMMTENLLNQVLADCRQAGNIWPQGFIFNVNISHSHLSLDSFGAFTTCFAQRFREMGLRLVFEFTENERIEMNDDLLNKIKLIRETGVSISLDDFGTGFSNLSWISTLNPDSIKIDRMFINQISPAASTPLINCVIAMAKQMGIKTVAEGVEHDYQVSWLQENNIDFFQGYYYSRPLPFSAFMKYCFDRDAASHA